MDELEPDHAGDGGVDRLHRTLPPVVLGRCTGQAYMKARKATLRPLSAIAAPVP
jgi:hypothetical protein